MTSFGTFRRSLLALLGFSLVLGLVGCTTPTLPLPPPSALTSAPDANGIVTVSGDVLPDAYVSCVNMETDQGVITRADASGMFSLQIEASVGDGLTLWQERGVERGPNQDLIVPAP